MKNIIWLLLLILAGTGAYFGYQAMMPKESLVRNLVVGTDATYPPLESLASAGKIVGFDIDLVQAIADQLKTKVEFKNVGFDDIFKELEEGKIDMIVSSVTITPERSAKYLFSSPYFNAGQVIVALKDSKIKGAADLKGKKVGAQSETTSLTEAQKLTEATNAKGYANYDLAVADLVDKKIEAIVIDLPAGVGLTTANTDLVIVGEPFTQEFYGMVMRKGDESVVSKVNEAIATFKQSGKLLEIRKKWKL